MGSLWVTKNAVVIPSTETPDQVGGQTYYMFVIPSLTRDLTVNAVLVVGSRLVGRDDKILLVILTN